MTDESPTGAQAEPQYTRMRDLEAIRADLDTAVTDYRRTFPAPADLAPNLTLAVELAAHVDEFARKSERDELMLRRFENGTFTFEAGGPTTEAVLLTFAEACAKFLDDSKATNYVEFTATSARGNRPRALVLVRRPGKPTPHDLRLAAEKERDELRAALAAATENVASALAAQDDALIALLDDGDPASVDKVMQAKQHLSDTRGRRAAAINDLITATNGAHA